MSEIRIILDDRADGRSAEQVGFVDFLSKVLDGSYLLRGSDKMER